MVACGLLHTCRCVCTGVQNACLQNVSKVFASVASTEMGGDFTHTHAHTCIHFPLVFRKKKRFMNNETIFSPGHYLLVWSKSWPFSPEFHISLDQFFLVLSITYLSLPIVSVFWSIPDDIWCVPLSIWKKISPSL